MRIDGKTEVCGLIGNPVEHSLSPFIHNSIAEIMNTNLVYETFLVDKGKLKDSIKGAMALHIKGMNVTVPYKSEVIPCLVKTDKAATSIGAVNTLVYTEEGYVGYNSDLPGLYRAMCSDGIDVKNKEVIIIGAGGVARAASYMCMEYGAAKVFLLNRTLEKAKLLSNEINKAFGKDRMIPMQIDDYQQLEGKKYIVIQATSAGLYPNCDDAPIHDNRFYKMVECGYDLIYNPAETEFMKRTKENGGVAFNGLKMLLFQAVISHELWIGKKIPQEVIDEVYERLMARKA